MTLCYALQSLDAGSVAALPEGLRVELEGIEDAGGVRFLQEMAAQIRVRATRHATNLVRRRNNCQVEYRPQCRTPQLNLYCLISCHERQQTRCPVSRLT